MHPLPEYPRPAMRRDSYENLNGLWKYAITQTAEYPAAWDGRILVPYSPETKASGVGRTLQPGQWLHYHCTFAPPPGEGGRVLLHFGAVDDACAVQVNGHLVGGHRGGYWPFTLDITAQLNDTGRNSLWVAVQDPTGHGTQARGKQTLKPGGMFYPAQSGIWQTVWLEKVPETYIKEIKTVPDIEKKIIRIKVSSSYSTDKKNVDKLSRNLPIEIKIRKPGLYPDPVVKPSQISTEDMLETAVLAVSDKWIELSLIHISEPTRPY